MKTRHPVSAVNDTAPAPAVVCACNVAFDPAQEWSTIRYGVYPNAVGLQVLDRTAAEAMVAAFNDKLSRLARGFRGLPGYIGHPDEPSWLARHPEARRDAIARVKELRVTDEGLQFRAAYNEDGKRLLTGEAPAFDAFSPRWGMAPIDYRGRKAFRPLELYSVGYTNNPNIPGSYIGLNEALPPEPPATPPMKIEELIALLAALGVTLAPDADPAAISAAIQSATEKAKGLQTASTTAANELSTLQAKLTAAEGKLATASNELTATKGELTTKTAAAAAEREARADLLLATAVNEGRLTAAQRPDWKTKLVTASNETFGAVAGELAALKPAVNTASKTAGLGARRGQTDPQAKARISAINEAVSAYQREHSVDHHSAYCAVKKAKPELFTPATE